MTASMEESEGPIEPVESAIYVDPNGDDTAPGTEAEPLRTLDEAQARVRDLVLAGEAPTVWLRGGLHARTTRTEPGLRPPMHRG